MLVDPLNQRHVYSGVCLLSSSGEVPVRFWDRYESCSFYLLAVIKTLKQASRKKQSKNEKKEWKRERKWKAKTKLKPVSQVSTYVNRLCQGHARVERIDPSRERAIHHKWKRTSYIAGGYRHNQLHTSNCPQIYKLLSLQVVLHDRAMKPLRIQYSFDFHQTWRFLW